MNRDEFFNLPISLSLVRRTSEFLMSYWLMVVSVVQSNALAPVIRNAGFRRDASAS